MANHGHRIRQQRCVQGMSVWLPSLMKGGSGTAGWVTEVSMAGWRARGLQAVLRGKEMNSTEVRLHYARWDINE